MNVSALTNKKGFGLIEVLVAVVVLALGILAVARFQGALIRSGSNANQRAVAATLAERQLEQFKTQVAGGGFAGISDGSDLGVTVGDSQYDVQWSVTSFYFPGNVVGAVSPVPTGEATDYKRVDFIVSWLGVSGVERIRLSSVVNSLAAGYTGLDIGAGASGEPPSVFYDPLQAPDVVPVTVGSPNIKKETSKPVPDVTKKGGTLATTFEAVTYSPSDNGYVTERREEFMTLSCGCTTTRATGPRTEGAFQWDPHANGGDGLLRDVRVTTAGQRYGISKKLVNGDETPPFECSICCENKEPLVDSGDYVQACRLKRIDGIMTVVPDWKLVGFDLIPDNFFDANATGMTTTLADANIDRYSDYVIDLVRDRLDAATQIDGDGNVSTLASVFYPDTGVRTSFNVFSVVSHFDDGTIDHKLTSTGSVLHLSARAVYMDLPPKEIFGTTFVPTNVPLVRVPFYTVNVTNLAAWVPDGDSNNDDSSPPDDPGDADFSRLSDYAEALVAVGAPSGHPTSGIHDPLIVKGNSSVSECNASIGRNCVTDEELTDPTESVYTRGDFYANQSAASTTVTARIKKSTSGLTDTVQNGVQNVADMPSGFSAESIDTSIDMTVE